MLRWATSAGDLLPTPQEEAAQAQQQATQVQQPAIELAARLQEMGVNPDEV